MEELRILGQVLKFLGIIIPLVLSIGGIHLFLYTRSPKYYFKISKLFSKWKDTNWVISAGYTVSKEVSFFKEFEHILNQIYGNRSFRRTFNLKNKKLYEFSDFTLTIQYDLDISQSDSVSVDLLFSNVNVTVNTASQKLKELRILFHEIEKALTLEDRWYNMNIKFNSLKNPFFGLMIQRLGEEHIEYFECEFPLSVLSNKQMDDPDINNFKLRVFKDYITINEKSFDVVEDVAKKCLLLR